jgi:alpha-tubulin suppressor-like RCC1 family protein
LLAFLLKVHAQYFEEVVTQLICGKNATLVLVQLPECFFQGINLDLLDLEPGQDGRDQSLEVGLSTDPFD